MDKVEGVEILDKERGGGGQKPQTRGKGDWQLWYGGCNKFNNGEGDGNLDIIELFVFICLDL